MDFFRGKTLEQSFINLLQAGSYLSIGLLFVGFVLTWWEWPQAAMIAQGGLATLLLVPVLRIILAIIFYFQHQERKLALISGLCLLLLGLGLYLGVA